MFCDKHNIEMVKDDHKIGEYYYCPKCVVEDNFSPQARNPGFLVMQQNGVWTFANWTPAGTIEQWRVKFNSELFSEKCGMNQVYRELARLNPPARNF